MEATGITGKLRFKADFLEHMHNYSVPLTVSFDTKVFQHTFNIKVIKCGPPMTAEVKDLNLSAFVGLPINFELPIINDSL